MQRTDKLYHIPIYGSVINYTIYQTEFVAAPSPTLSKGDGNLLYLSPNQLESIESCILIISVMQQQIHLP